MTDPALPDAVPAPQAPTVDVEKLKADLAAEFEAKMNERISGLQSSYQAQINERDAQLRELKTASLSEEEREQLALKERDEELERLRTQLWLAEQSQNKPKAAEVYRKILEAENDDDVIALLDGLTAAPATTAPPEEEAQVPDVDPNNPSIHSTNSELVTLPDGRQITAEFAEKFLQDLPRWPSY